MKPFIERIVCLSRAHCQACREGTLQDAPVTCPFGITSENIPPVVRPPVVSTECEHRGAEIRREECPSCFGKVMVKIMACTVHSECTLSGKPIPGVRTCQGCTDRL